MPLPGALPVLVAAAIVSGATVAAALAPSARAARAGAAGAPFSGHRRSIRRRLAAWMRVTRRPRTRTSEESI